MLSNLRKRNPNKVIIGSININFLAGQFEAIKGFIKSKLDILVLQETKIDSTYPTSQFLIEGFDHPFRLDHNKHWSGIMIYIKDNLPCKQITFDTQCGNWPKKNLFIKTLYLIRFQNYIKFLN